MLGARGRRLYIFLLQDRHEYYGVGYSDFASSDLAMRQSSNRNMLFAQYGLRRNFFISQN